MKEADQWVLATLEGASAETHEDKLKELIAFCRKGPAGAKVDDVKVGYEEARNEFEGFSIRY